MPNPRSNLALGLLLAALATTNSALEAAPVQKLSSAVMGAIHAGPAAAAAQVQQEPRWTTTSSAREIQLFIEVDTVTAQTLEALRALGADIETTDPAQGLIQLRIPAAQVQTIADLPEVTFIRLPDLPIRNHQGAIATEGDAVMRTHLRRLRLGATGAGVRVGVISNGVDGLTASVTSGDLPSSGLIVPAAALSGNDVAPDSPLPGAIVLAMTPGDRPDLTQGAEGRAMLEIIHDIAPNAQLYFAPVGGTSLTYPRAVSWLAAQGVQVIADDIVFLNAGPYDGSSTVARVAETASSNGIAYFQAGGNFARQHYRGEFNDGDGDGLHEFDASLGMQPNDGAGETLNVTVAPGQTVQILLQWNDGFGTSSNDYNLCVSDPADDPTATLFCSTNPQIGAQSPTERLLVTNSQSQSQAGTLGISIRRSNVEQARIFDLYVLSARMEEFVVPAGSVPNKADAHGGVISVGAVNWLAPGFLEPFSSQGPTADGRMKPEVVAPDGVATSVPGFAPFFGTSAATPHAAAAWALALEQDPDLSVDQVTQLLPNVTADLGTAGPDNQFGYGRVDAFPQAPRGTVTVDRAQYRTGDTLRVRVSLRPGSELNGGDLFAFVLLPPNGDPIFSLTLDEGGTLLGVPGLEPLATNAQVMTLEGPIFEYTFVGDEPPGLYRVVGALSLPQSATPTPGPGDLEQTITFDTAAFEFLP